MYNNLISDNPFKNRISETEMSKTDTFTVTITYKTVTLEASFSVTITHPNRKPQLKNIDNITINDFTSTTLHIDKYFMDLDGDNLLWYETKAKI